MITRPRMGFQAYAEDSSIGMPDWWGILILAPIANFILPGVLAWTD
jgi:hypothetical protein